MQIDRTLKDLHNVKSDCAILCFEAIPVMFKDTVFACCTALRQNTEADDQKQTQFCVPAEKFPLLATLQNFPASGTLGPPVGTTCSTSVGGRTISTIAKLEALSVKNPGNVGGKDGLTREHLYLINIQPSHIRHLQCARHCAGTGGTGVNEI